MAVPPRWASRECGWLVTLPSPSPPSAHNTAASWLSLPRARLHCVVVTDVQLALVRRTLRERLTFWQTSCASAPAGEFRPRQYNKRTRHFFVGCAAFFKCSHLTIRSSRCRFAARLNSGVRRHKHASARKVWRFRSVGRLVNADGLSLSPLHHRRPLSTPLQVGCPCHAHGCIAS